MKHQTFLFFEPSLSLFYELYISVLEAKLIEKVNHHPEAQSKE